jgi:RasGEF domain
MQLQLERPAAAVAFDFKSGRCVKVNCPLEHIKAGSLRGLIQYGCFYAARARKPELVGANQNRIGLDEDFNAIFWTMISSVTDFEKVLAEVDVHAKELLVPSATRSTQPLDALQICEFLVSAIDPTATSGRALFRLPYRFQEELLALADGVVDMVEKKTMPSWEGDAEATAFVPTIEESVARLKDAMKMAKTLSAIVCTSLASVSPGTAEEGKWEPSPQTFKDFPALAKLPPTLVPRQATLLFPRDIRNSYPSLWHAPYDVLAAQWTLIEHGMLRTIPLYEWLACGWDNPRYLHTADAIRRFIDHFNAIALWVTAEVLAQDTPQDRAASIVRFVKLGVVLRAYNNFTALAELSMGLRRSSVQRLKQTWELVPEAAMKQLEALFAVVEDKRNYKNYKDALKVLPPGVPCVPHLGPHTAEMTMQDQLLSSEIASNDGTDGKYIHFRRLRELYKLTSPLIEMQDCGYEVCHAAESVATGLPFPRPSASTGAAADATAAGSSTHQPPPVLGMTKPQATALREVFATASPALLRMPAHNPSLCNMLDAVVRPFHFAFEEDRNIVVRNLERRSKQVEPDPKAPGSEADGSLLGDGSGLRETLGSSSTGRGRSAGPAGGGAAADGGGGLLGMTKRFFSPSRGKSKGRSSSSSGGGHADGE